ncbi:hypothetical protein U1Q18_018717, partial [Sarracenia purpurea var. burkii]
QRFGENVGQLLDPNHASILKPAAATGQPSGQVLHGTAGAMSAQVQSRNQQLPGSTPDIKTEMNQVLNPRAAGPEGSLIGIPDSGHLQKSREYRRSHGISSLGLDQLRPGFLQQQKSFMQGPHPFNQLQMLTPQQQQQFILAQQNLTSPSASDVENRRLRLLLNNRSMNLGKDGLANSVGDVVSNVGSPLQAGCPVLPRGDPDTLMKIRIAQLQHHQQLQNSNQQQQPQQHALSGQQSQSSNHNLHQQDKMVGASSVTADGSMANSFRANDQVCSFMAYHICFPFIFPYK